jgi:hypothetical protein
MDQLTRCPPAILKDIRASQTSLTQHSNNHRALHDEADGGGIGVLEEDDITTISPDS